MTKINENTKPKENQSSTSNSVKEKLLVLHNDEHNLFDFVVETLISVCKHDPLQAEQCTLIVHHKGKCDVKRGSFKKLKPYKEALQEKGLTATIE